ncbi:Cardiolipin synthase [uncultured archaeon]|nr:Cardiolipin synthase [uncultured archaeon]
MAMMNWWDGFGSMMGSWWGGMFGFSIAAVVAIIINVIAVLWALADVMRSRRLDVGERIGWVIIILSLQIVGVLLYIFVGREGREERGYEPSMRRGRT